ncbi:MAG: formate--tetrahydrofolate ligase [candidate division WOR-3 bacterium]|nr:formate--tetrahydrofolate ligase [candidate division WOR-3 bacterium]
MKTDIEIAQSAKLIPIEVLADKMGINESFVLPCGRYKAKISLQFYEKIKSNPDGKLILVTAITPTAFGEGKTTVAIGLSMAFNQLGKKSIVTLREPSLGPVFGIKGGAAGGGYAQVLPMEDINLHFTGDIHAVGSAHNLLCAVLDNHIHFGNKLQIDEREIVFKRTMDMNDRSLRNIVVGLGGKTNGPAREDGFIITAASEIMAILGLSSSLSELKQRLCRILVAFDINNNPVTAGNLGVCGSMAVLLKDALKPNLVQTIEHTPAFIHTGPFANIAHGTSSVIATKMALKLAEYVVIEAGFGSDLGAEKFIDIVSRVAGFKVDVAVIVATIRALKLHGGANEKDLKSGTIEHLQKGFSNLAKHIENVRKLGMSSVVALNIFSGDTKDEIENVKAFCAQNKVPCVEVYSFHTGGKGAIELAETIIKTVEQNPSNPQPIYELEDSIETKIEKVATEIYGANRVVYTPKAEKDIARIIKLGYEKLPICIAKTNRSLSDDPTLYGRPENFKITITDINISAGAGFLVPLAGDITLMPGLAKTPNAMKIDIDENGRIVGLS